MMYIFRQSMKIYTNTIHFASRNPALILSCKNTAVITSILKETNTADNGFYFLGGYIMAFGANIDHRKNNKRNHIIDLFRKHRVLSKVQAKQLSGYSMDTILSVFDALIKEHIIAETDAEQKPKGRKATFFTLNKDHTLYLGITFNQFGIYSSLVSFTHEITENIITEYPAQITDRDMFLAQFNEHLHMLKDTIADRMDHIRAIGCSVPGAVDPETGILHSYVLMPFLKDINFTPIISAVFPGIEIWTEHNIKSMTSYFLSSVDIVSKYNKILYVSIRSGVASGIICNGQIVTDNGELGHIRVSDEDKRCICGKKGCLDLYFSYDSVSTALMKYLNKDTKWIKINEMIGLYKSGHPQVREVIDSRLIYFAKAIHDAINFIGPDLVILSGKLLACYDNPVAEIRRIIDDIYPDSGLVMNYSRAELRFIDVGAEIAAQGICAHIINKQWSYTIEDPVD